MSNSIGDLKNSGLQGNNWPWQYKVLLGLDGIINAINATETEYEAQIVKATCPGPTPTSGYYLEIRIYNTTTGSFGAPTYYLPGSTTPVNLSTCTKEYANDSAVLTQIYNELIAQGLTLDAIETAVEGTLTVQANDLDIRPLTCTDIVSLCFDNAGTPTPVSNTNPLPVNAIVTVPSSLDTTIVGPVGVQADCANAVSTVLCQAQQDILTNIEAAVEGTLDVNVTNTGLDIRPLDCTTDSVAICNGTGNALGIGLDGSIAVNLIDSVNGTQAVVNSDGTQNNAIYGYDHTSLQNEQITSVGISATVQALDVNIANSVPTLDVAIVNPLGVQANCDFAVSTALCQTQEDILTDIKTNTDAISITPNIQISSGDAATAIAVAVYSVTFFNNGSVDVLVSFSGGGVGTYVTIPAGTSINMDAGGINNQYPANTFYYDTFTADPLGSLIVTYNS